MLNFSIFRKYNLQDDWRVVYYAVPSKLELNKKMNALVVNDEDSYLQIRTKAGEIISTHQVKNKKAAKIEN